MSALHLRRRDSLGACGRKTPFTTTDSALVTCRHCLRQIEIAKRQPPEPKPQPEPASYSFFTKIAGVTFANPDGSPRQEIILSCRVGEPLQLIREPTNPVDPEGAVKIVRMNGQQLGYVPAHVTRGGWEWSGLAADMDAGERYWARISDLTGGGPPWTHGVNIEISNREFADAIFYPPTVSRQPDHPDPALLIFVAAAVALALIAWVVAEVSGR